MNFNTNSDKIKKTIQMRFQVLNSLFKIQILQLSINYPKGTHVQCINFKCNGGQKFQYTRRSMKIV